MANAFYVPAGQGSSATFATAIAGDNPWPYGAANLQNGMQLTTGDLGTADAGEMGDLTEFAVEFWFRNDVSRPGVDGTIVAGPISSSGASRQYAITLLAGGALSFAVTDDTGAARTIASTSTALQVALYYHVVATAQGGNLNVYLNGVVDGTTNTWGSHSVRALGSTAGSMDLLLNGPVTVGPQFSFDEVAVYHLGLTAARVLEHYNAGVNRGWRQQLPGARIGSILDAVSSPAPRSIQLGSRNVIPRYMSGQAPLEEIRRSVEAEDVDAGFFVKADGTLTFLADGHRSSSPYNTSQVTLGDAGGSEIPYESIAVDYSETNLINEWNVTRSVYASASTLLPPSTQTASDATSISRYFKRSQSLSDVPVTLDSDASAIATALLAKYKDPMLRVTQVGLNLGDPSVAEAVFRRELMDKITVKRTPPGGGSRISQDLFIQRVEISGANDGKPWSGTWGVSPL